MKEIKFWWLYIRAVTLYLFFVITDILIFFPMDALCSILEYIMKIYASSRLRNKAFNDGVIRFIFNPKIVRKEKGL